MQYELRQYDITLMIFSMERVEIGKLQYSIDYINEDKKNILPIGMELSPEGLEKWLRSRVIPKNREYVDQLLAKNGLSHGDIMGIINTCRVLSLNDSYWIVEKGFAGKFEDYNLFQNNFARTLALIAYTGYGTSTKKGFQSSPEFTTNGMLKKCWRRINGKVYLYKGGTSGASNAGNEPYSEYLASQIATKMNINHVDYNLARWKGTLCSTCELFTNINTSFVPFYRFKKSSSLTETINYLKNLGDEFYNAFADMIVFDALIFNTDRHEGNYGFLVDNKTNKPISFAPIFDNGLSLFNYAVESDLEDLKEYSKTRFPSIDGVTFEELVKEVISERQKEKLRKMINFKFKKHSKYNMPKKRITLIEKYLQVRVNELLNIKK